MTGFRSFRIVAWVACATILVASAACGGPPRASGVSTPAVHELARLQSMGRLDQARLACAATALVPVTEALQERLPALRAAEAAALSLTSRDHARSVQEGMAASDALEQARQAEFDMRRSAEYLAATGDRSTAAQYLSFAMDMVHNARNRGDVRVASGSAVAWSDEDVSLLVEYASLRAALTDSVDPPQGVRDRVAEIEGGHPRVMDGYAEMLLRVYGDPGLQCARFPR